MADTSVSFQWNDKPEIMSHISPYSRMLFPGDYSVSRQFKLFDTEISKQTKEAPNRPINKYHDIVSSASRDRGCTKTTLNGYNY